MKISDIASAEAKTLETEIERVVKRFDHIAENVVAMLLNRKANALVAAPQTPEPQVGQKDAKPMGKASLVPAEKTSAAPEKADGLRVKNDQTGSKTGEEKPAS